MPTDFGIEDESREKDNAISTLNTVLKEPAPDPRERKEETLKETIKRLLGSALDAVNKGEKDNATVYIKKALKASEEIR